MEECVSYASIICFEWYAMFQICFKIILINPILAATIVFVFLNKNETNDKESIIII